MTDDRRPLDADGNPPLRGQMDVYDVISQKMRDDTVETDEARIHRKSQEALGRPMTAAEVVSARLRGKK